MGHGNLFSKTKKTLPGSPHKNIAKAGEAPLPQCHASLRMVLIDEVHRRRRCPVFIDLPVWPSFLKRYCHDQGPLIFQKSKIMRKFYF
jgi:hypothetical protein